MRQILVALFLGLILSSCTIIPTYSDEIGYKWKFKRAPIDESKWRYFVKHLDDPVCPKSYACAVIRQPNVFCHLYIPNNAAKWVVEHEQQHCKGYNHQPRSYSEIQHLLTEK